MSMKEYLFDVGLKTLAPSAIRGAVLGVAGWLMAKNNLLTPFGITTMNHVTTIDWNQVSIASIAAVPGLMAAIIKLANHHAAQILPQKASSNDQSK